MTFQFQTVSVELAPSGSRDKRVNEIGVTRDRAVAQNQSKVNSRERTPSGIEKVSLSSAVRLRELFL